MTTKILALTDALGNLVRLVLLPGQRFDTFGVPSLLDGVGFEAPRPSSRSIRAGRHPRKIDTEMYKWRHLIKNFFCKPKEFKGIAMTADKTDRSFAATIHLAAAVIAWRRTPTDPRLCRRPKTSGL